VRDDQRATSPAPSNSSRAGGKRARESELIKPASSKRAKDRAEGGSGAGTPSGAGGKRAQAKERERERDAKEKEKEKARGDKERTSPSGAYRGVTRPARGDEGE
jgi:hypothetical protein